MTTATEREYPPIETLEDMWCWLNTWGDRNARTRHGTLQRSGYEMAIGDALRALEKAGVTFETVPNDLWRRWSRA